MKKDGACYRLPENPKSRERVDRFLARTGANGYVVIHPGTSGFAVEKRWDTDRFGELARRIVDESELRVFVTWGPDERGMAEEVSARSGGRAVPALATGSLLDLAELIRRASLFVSGDTGPMHLAAACGTPCIALFGPKDPEIYRPYGEGHLVIHKGRNGEPVSMDSISVDEVFEAVQERLQSGGRR
jgi:ADP-heptose:LPS heptosyltransferase